MPHIRPLFQSEGTANVSAPYDYVWLDSDPFVGNILLLCAKVCPLQKFLLQVCSKNLSGNLQAVLVGDEEVTAKLLQLLSSVLLSKLEHLQDVVQAQVLGKSY